MTDMFKTQWLLHIPPAFTFRSSAFRPRIYEFCMTLKIGLNSNTKPLVRYEFVLYRYIVEFRNLKVW
jgi:hypothetical protein